jgi:predicted dithiol-disulfide oxidoreductase (DUF899 family)
MSKPSTQINDLQKEIFEKQQQLAKLRLEQEPEWIKNYSFKDIDGNSHSLIDLFDGKDELLLIHNMGKSCVYCTMWADTLSGMNHLINDRVKMVLTSPDEHSIMKEFTTPRNWQFPSYSYAGSSFSIDKEGRHWYEPGVSALILKDGKVYRTAKDNFGPGDVYCAPWHLFALLPKGADGWHPKYTY